MYSFSISFTYLTLIGILIKRIGHQHRLLPPSYDASLIPPMHLSVKFYITIICDFPLRMNSWLIIRNCCYY